MLVMKPGGPLQHGICVLFLWKSDKWFTNLGRDGPTDIIKESNKKVNEKQQNIRYEAN